MTTKRCFKCQCEKPIEAFYKHAAMGDGRLGKCKDCTKADVTRHRQENLEAIRAYDRRRGSMPHRVAARAEYAKTPNYAKNHAASIKRWIERHPERRKANYLVSNAIRDGRLKKLPCLACGQKAEAHHPDYDRPLDVVWLCKSHHKQAHDLVKADLPTHLQGKSQY